MKPLAAFLLLTVLSSAHSQTAWCAWWLTGYYSAETDGWGTATAFYSYFIASVHQLASCIEENTDHFFGNYSGECDSLIPSFNTTLEPFVKLCGEASDGIMQEVDTSIEFNPQFGSTFPDASWTGKMAVCVPTACETYADMIDWPTGAYMKKGFPDSLVTFLPYFWSMPCWLLEDSILPSINCDSSSARFGEDFAAFLPCPYPALLLPGPHRRSSMPILLYKSLPLLPPSTPS